VVLQVPTDGADGAVPDAEDLPGPLVGLQVGVALPVAGLHVPQAVPLLWKRAQRLAQQLERLHPDAGLAAPCPTQPPGRSYHVAGIEVAEAAVLAIAEHIALRDQLDLPRPVAQGGEGHAARHPLHHQPTGDRDRRRVDLGLTGQERQGLRRRVGAVEARHVRLHALRQQALELLAAVPQGSRQVFVGGGHRAESVVTS
jgi:hypothetical protein